MISTVRDYIKSKVLTVDSDLKENPSAFYNGDIAETILENSYQIEINNFTQTIREVENQAEVAITLRIFGHGAREELDNYDCLFDKAIEIRDNIISHQSLNPSESRGFVVDANAGSIEAESLDTDENTFQFIITCTLTVAYTTEG